MIRVITTVHTRMMYKKIEINGTVRMMIRKSHERHEFQFLKKWDDSIVVVVVVGEEDTFFLKSFTFGIGMVFYILSALELGPTRFPPIPVTTLT